MICPAKKTQASIEKGLPVMWNGPRFAISLRISHDAGRWNAPQGIASSEVTTVMGLEEAQIDSQRINSDYDKVMLDFFKAGIEMDVMTKNRKNSETHDVFNVAEIRPMIKRSGKELCSKMWSIECLIGKTRHAYVVSLRRANLYWHPRTRTSQFQAS